MTTLSNHDSAVLRALFDPELSLDQHSDIVILEKQSGSHLRREEEQILRVLKDPFPSEEDMIQAIDRLSELIERNPTYASAYNNRAQTKRMLGCDVKNIFADLATAIELASPQDLKQPITSEAAQVLASAHTHRGVLLLSCQSTPEKLPDDVLRKVSAVGIEDIASREFSLGGKFGNNLARQLAVRTNPYAKLCGSIVKQALQKEIETCRA